MKQPWPPSIATERIRWLARHEQFDLAYTRHALERLQERSLTTDDIIHVLQHGFVHEASVPARPTGFFKYCMEAQTPNSGNRMVRVVVIPDTETTSCKIITVMWVDER